MSVKLLQEDKMRSHTENPTSETEMETREEKSENLKPAGNVDRQGCSGCRICDLANKRYGYCVSGICGCHLLKLSLKKSNVQTI